MLCFTDILVQFNTESLIATWSHTYAKAKKTNTCGYEAFNTENPRQPSEKFFKV